MARKSAAAQSVVAPAVTGAPIDAPTELSIPERALWQKVVNSKPAEWFGPDSVPVLKEYVRAAATCDRLDALVSAAFDGAEGMDLKTVLGLRDKEAKRCADLATKLRLTQQSRYTPQAAATADKRASGARPWQSAA